MCMLSNNGSCIRTRCCAVDVTIFSNASIIPPGFKFTKLHVLTLAAVLMRSCRELCQCTQCVLEWVGLGRELAPFVVMYLCWPVVGYCTTVVHAWWLIPGLCLSIWTINEPHLIEQAYRCYAKSPTAQDAFRSIPGLISYAGVTRRWGLLYHAWQTISQTARWIIQQLCQLAATSHKCNNCLYRRLSSHCRITHCILGIKLS